LSHRHCLRQTQSVCARERSLPSIEQVIAWLHLLFDAWEDYKRQREHAEAEAAVLEASAHAAMIEPEHDDMLDDDEDDDEDDKERRKKKKRRKDKDKHRK